MKRSGWDIHTPICDDCRGIGHDFVPPRDHPSADHRAPAGAGALLKMAVKLVVGILLYFVATVVAGFSVIFLFLGGGLGEVWGQQIGIVLAQFAIPHRAPFAIAIVSFVASVPVMLGLWHAIRPRILKMTTFAPLAMLTTYGMLLLTVFALAQAAPRFSIREGLNLKFALVGLGIWTVIAIVWAIPAGAVVNRLFRSDTQTRN